MRVAGQALGVDPDGHGLAVDGLVAVDERGVLLAVDRVPEPHGVEVAVAGGQLRGGGDPDADMLLADAGAVVGGVALDDGVEDGEGHRVHQVWERPGRGWAPGAGLVGGYVCGTRRDVRAAALLRRAPAAARVDHEDRCRARRRCSRRRAGRPGPRRGSRPDPAPRCGRPGSSASVPDRIRWCSSPWWAWTPVACPGGAVTSRMHTSREVPASTSVEQRAARHRSSAAAPSCARPRRGRRVEQEPGRRHVEGAGDRGERLERGYGLVVLDLAEVADVEPARLAHLGERQRAGLAPAARLAADLDDRATEPRPSTPGSLVLPQPTYLTSGRTRGRVRSSAMLICPQQNVKPARDAPDGGLEQ